MKEPSQNIWVNAGIIVTTVVFLSAVQAVSPGLPWSGLKLPLAVYAGVYWMVFGGPWTGWLGALWAGAALDGLGGVGWGAGILGMAAMCWGMRKIREVSGVWATIPGCALACGTAGLLVVLAQGMMNGGLRATAWARVAAGSAEVFAAGALAGVVVCGCLWGLDVWLGNFKEREAHEGSWPGDA